VALAAIACSSFAATPAKSQKKRHPVAAASSTTASKHKTVAARSASAKATPPRRGKGSRSSTRSYQVAPTADRYKEIQQALAAKGYLHSEPNGQWGADSADALKRFQADQSLMPDGKINSLSLIALGLGPKRLTAKSDVAPQPQAASPAPDLTPAAPAPPQ
jgi:Putative peptidoglycan binding domain